MVSGDGADTATLARDRVFAAAMITCNGILGLSLLVGTLRRGVAAFNAEGTASALATEGGVHLVLFAAFLFLAINP
jgi:Ca2+:H+ antiporter